MKVLKDAMWIANSLMFMGFGAVTGLAGHAGLMVAGFTVSVCCVVVVAMDL